MFFLSFIHSNINLFEGEQLKEFYVKVCSEFFPSGEWIDLLNLLLFFPVESRTHRSNFGRWR